jgi:hypothetical protein
MHCCHLDALNQDTNRNTAVRMKSDLELSHLNVVCTVHVLYVGHIHVRPWWSCATVISFFAVCALEIITYVNYISVSNLKLTLTFNFLLQRVKNTFVKVLHSCNDFMTSLHCPSASREANFVLQSGTQTDNQLVLAVHASWRELVV